MGVPHHPRPCTADRGVRHWDATLLRNIAQYGYFSPHSTANNTVFFPGYPMALAAAHLILRNWVLSELTVAGVAGCFAVISLSRLAGGRRAVLYLLTAPAAIFLWSDTPSACSWRSPSPPGTLRPGAGGGAPRCWRDCLGWCVPDAMFMIPALAVMALTGPRGRRLANAGKACCALAGPAAYEVYLTARTGTWKPGPKRSRQAGTCTWPHLSRH